MSSSGRTSFVAAAVAALVVLLATSACTSDAEADPDPPTIGFVRVIPSADHDTFVRELRALGWRPGVDVRIVPTNGDEVFETPDDVRDALAAWEQEGLGPDLVIAYSTPYARLVQEETDLPGLFVVTDPLAGGLISDLDHPDRGFSGVTWRTPADRTLDLAARAFGGLDRIGYLVPDEDAAGAAHRDLVVAAADRLGVDVVQARFTGPDDAADAVATVAEMDVDAVYLSSSNGTVHALMELEGALDAQNLPVIANNTFVDSAVIVLTPDLTELHRQLARQAARLLNGADVTVVPVEHPRRYKAIIDRTRAESIGREIDPSVLREADLVR
jgi:putative tryptophan/tyrosine transport system substrate-binding protein